MTRETEILNLLLDRYERSGHCLPGRDSTRKVALSFARGEYPPYRENDPCIIEMNQSVEALSNSKFVSYNWKKGYEGWLIDRVWLNLDSLTQIYAKVCRTPLCESSASLHEILEHTKTSIRTQWKLDFLEDELSHLRKMLRPSRLLSGDEAQVRALLKVLQYTEQGSELMRVISVNCFRDSKYLENELLSQLTSIAKAYEPELVAYRAAGEERLTKSVVLEQVGILTYPEIFELCGNIRFHVTDEFYFTGMFLQGFCLQSENMIHIKDIALPEIKTILLIENRTNYFSIVRKGVCKDMLVVWHGGFYSPAKRNLFRMLKNGSMPGTEVLFWGDIDLGGFLMFTRLKKDIFPNLFPWKMSLDDYNAYKDCGTPRPITYITSLKQRMEENQFDETFFTVTQAILANGVTVEQEIML